MEIELRVGWQPVSDHMLAAGADAIGVGDEGCVHRLAALDIAGWLSAISRAGLVPRLVTPRTAETDLERVTPVLRAAADAGTEPDVVVNDLGVLQLCRRILPQSRILLGRVLARSVTDCPWHRLALRSESQAVIDDLMRHSFDHRPKIELCRRLNVVAIEAHCDASIADSLRRITENGIGVKLHLGRRLLTLGRDCASARWAKAVPPSCIGSCREQFHLSWTGVYRSPTDSDVPVTDQHQRLLPAAVVDGNRVLGETATDPGVAHRAGAVGVIIDAGDDPGHTAAIIRETRKEVLQWEACHV